VVIATPAPRHSRHGNRTTALRWAALLRRLGARVRVVQEWRGEPCDLLVAVHAVKSARSVAAAADAQPRPRIVVLLAGTDVYPMFAPGPAERAALASADALLALQPLVADSLPPEQRGKLRTFVQSATAVPAARPADRIRICVLAHLRPVKDPLLPVRALALVPPAAPIELRLAGRALDPSLADEANAAAAREPRFRWLGELSRRESKRLLAGSHLCVVPSAAEGGANVVSEAIAAGTPLLATAVPGNVGLLGGDWPGLFAAGDAAGLAALMQRVAEEPSFHQRLVERTRALQPLVDPRHEMEAWRRLLVDLGLG
jgi:putative glycosyltransferase (TIGR04348 family)